MYHFWTVLDDSKNVFGAHFVSLLDHKKVVTFFMCVDSQCKILTFSGSENEIFTHQNYFKNTVFYDFCDPKNELLRRFLGDPKNDLESWISIAKTQSQVVHVFPTFHDFWSSWGSKKSLFRDIFTVLKRSKNAFRESKKSISQARNVKIMFIKLCKNVYICFFSKTKNLTKYFKINTNLKKVALPGFSCVPELVKVVYRTTFC